MCIRDSVNQALSNIDFLPTVLNLMQVPFQHKVDGRDATALFTGQPAAGWNDVTIVRSTSGRSPWLSAITERYKLVVSLDEQPWLIDVREDPNELTNLFGDATHRPIAKRLGQALQTYVVDHDDSHGALPRMKSWIQQVAN